MKILTVKQIESFFRALEPDYDVMVPIRAHDGTRSLGRLKDGPLALAGGAVPRKITDVFFPQAEIILTITDDNTRTQQLVPRPMFVVGFTAQDADCLGFIDRFFSENYRDDVYFNKRDGSVIVCVSGWCGAGGEFLKIAGGKCDIELICDGKDFIVAAYTRRGKSIIEEIRDAKQAPPELLGRLQRQSELLPGDELELIQKASKLLLEEKVPDDFWETISVRCIACTACNLVCPTCTCFDVFDRKINDKTVRYRLWDSCQLDGFMRQAGGHNPMGSEALRTRRRIHHKLAADVVRWGQITCFNCGRCDKACPTGIGMIAVCREMVEKYGSE